MAKISSKGYCIAWSSHGYGACFDSLSEAREAAEKTAKKIRMRVDVIKVSNRGEDRHVVDSFGPKHSEFMGSEGEEEEMEYDDEAEPEDEGPQEDDWTTEDHRHFYQGGKLVLTVSGDASDAEMNFAIQKKMEKDGFFPNVWLISDHGNAHLIDTSDIGEEVPGIDCENCGHPRPWHGSEEDADELNADYHATICTCDKFTPEKRRE